MGLAQVACDVWEGFVFINLDPNPSQTLAEFLGAMGTGLAGFPFDKMTQRFTLQSEVRSNWKLYVDAFVEFYHAPVLHQRQAEANEAAKLLNYGFEALHYELISPHSLVSSWGGMSPPKDPSMVKPIENALRSGLFGPWESPDVVDEWPELVNRSGHRSWGTDSFVIFPNFMILIWERQWYLTYHYWPLSENTHLFEVSIYFVPPKTAADRLRQEHTVAVTKEYALQDANTLEATQRMIETGVVKEFHLNDQEILCRHHHYAVREFVRAHEAGTPVNFPWNRATASA
jgi:phenylpropionate dioxygenase-like ring-hydroxylating dioxygenase large terminal subunit